VSEQLVAEARVRGLTANIYRMDFITAAERGEFKMTDLVPRLVADAANFGVLPDDDVRLDLVPVDVLAQMIVLLSRSGNAAGKTFHLLNHERLSMAKIASILHDAGYPVRRVPYDAWRTKISANKEAQLYPLTPFLESYDSEDLRLSIAQGADNRQAVAHLGALDPEIYRRIPSMESLMRRLIADLRTRGLIPS
jgi:thioester reductase-like protein